MNNESHRTLGMQDFCFVCHQSKLTSKVANAERGLTSDQPMRYLSAQPVRKVNA